MTDIVRDSEFYMWRTLFAVAHADNVVTNEEISFMTKILNDVQFSDDQTDILKDDITHAKDAMEMFKGITDKKDRIKFFEFARELVWSDGDFDEREQSVMIKLYKYHLSDTTVDELVGKISTIRLEDEPVKDIQHVKIEKPSLKKTLLDFKDKLLGKE